MITGAGGNVGSAIAHGLHKAGFDLKLTDRNRKRELPVPVMVANLLNRDLMYQVVEGCDAVVHLGNHPTFGHTSDAQTVYGENCTMNMNVMQAALEFKVKKFVFISTIQVINGDRSVQPEEDKTPPSMLKYLPIDSDTPANPRNPYSQSKRAGELLLEHYLAPAGMQCVSIRLPWCASGHGWNWVKGSYGENVYRFSLVDEGFSYLHAQDLTSLVEAVLRTDLPGYRSYLPAAETPSVNIPVAKLIERFFKGVEVRRPVSEMTSLSDNSKITRETGWKPRWALGRPDPE